jgi:hypothetical protein
MMFLITILIPLLVSARQRTSLFEVTRSGTVIGVIYVMIFFFVFIIVDSFTGTYLVFLPEFKGKVAIARSTIILLMIAALIPTYKLAKKEFKKFDFRS